MKPKIEQVLFTSDREIKKEDFTEMVYLKPILSNILDSFFKELNIIMVDKFIPIKYMKENSILILGKDMV